MPRLLVVVVSRSTVITAIPPLAPSTTVTSEMVTGLSAGELVGDGVKVAVLPPPLPLDGVGVLVGTGVDVDVAAGGEVG